MKNKKFIIIGVVVLIVALLSILLIRRERNVNVYEYPDTVVVTNHTKHKNADTYSKIILNKIFEYDTITLNIYYASRDYGTEEYDVAGFIQKNPYVPHTYNVFVKKNGLPTSIKHFLSHELIHLRQMESGDLIPIDQYTQVYKGDTISFLDTPYRERLFETEAINTQNDVLKQLNHLLYSNF